MRLFVNCVRESVQLPFTPDIEVPWQALFEARRAHWMYGVYLICSVSGGNEVGENDQVSFFVACLQGADCAVAPLIHLCNAPLEIQVHI